MTNLISLSELINYISKSKIDSVHSVTMYLIDGVPYFTTIFESLPSYETFKQQSSSRFFNLINIDQVISDFPNTVHLKKLIDKMHPYQIIHTIEFNNTKHNTGYLPFFIHNSPHLVSNPPYVHFFDETPCINELQYPDGKSFFICENLKIPLHLIFNNTVYRIKYNSVHEKIITNILSDADFADLVQPYKDPESLSKNYEMLMEKLRLNINTTQPSPFSIEEISTEFRKVHTELQQAIRGIIHQSQ